MRARGDFLAFSVTMSDTYETDQGARNGGRKEEEGRKMEPRGTRAP